MLFGNTHENYNFEFSIRLDRTMNSCIKIVEILKLFHGMNSLKNHTRNYNGSS